MRTLSHCLWLLVACGSSDTSELEHPRDAAAYPDAEDASVDGDAGLERRRAPDCEALAGEPSTRIADVHLETDFFASACNLFDIGALPDRAYTWTAPASGLYLFQLDSSALYREARLTFELRRGDCVTTDAEGGAEPATRHPLCGEMYLTEDGVSPRYRALDVEEGETITLVVEGQSDFRAYHAPESPLEPVLATLSVERALCPAAPERSSDGEHTMVEELPSRAPVSLEIASSVRDGVLLLERLSCVETLNTRQHTVGWTAPEAGRYVFEAERDNAYSGGMLAVAALRGSCTGDELACGAGELRADATLELRAGERVVVVVEVDAYSDDDERITLRITGS